MGELMRSAILCFAFWLGAQWAWAQKGAFEKQVYYAQGDSLLYQILLPNDFQEGKKYPLILFLHGAGERGDDNEKQLKLGGSLFESDSVQQDYPAIIVFPQCPEGTMWTARQKQKDRKGDWRFNFPVPEHPPKPSEMVNALVDSLRSGTQVDPSRVYIMGISMGGIGTLEFLHRWPEKYAAAAVICGGHNPQLTGNYHQVPIWFFHGGKDDVVPPAFSKAVFKRIKRKNKASRYTLYPEANHNSWDDALAEPQLLNWLFQFKHL
ncbi:alpha/beta hydrolase-fold protein [Persicobacter diffluens]|uniref:Phospholipase n=1 Tax=Persicobacter diffluens TaxID=981 RepID=A0AAN4W1Z7_9BACT|nr:phospholipase [Persicobacter diffluens]